MSDLEKYIMDHREAMDTEEPATGHVHRFSKKLKESGGRKLRINFRHALQIAASIALIIASGIVIVRSGKGGSKVAENPVTDEFHETTVFYARQVDQRYEDISGYTIGTQEERKILMEELSEMDTYYRDLLDELDANPGDERVMNALIRHYQLKLEVLDRIVAQLEQIKNSNSYNNEKTTL